MDFLTKKNFLYKLIICLCIVLTIMNFSGVQRVYAAEDAPLGGVLMTPICNLLLGISDAIMNIVQDSIVGTDALITVDNKEETNWGAIFLAALAVAVVVVLWIVPGTQGIAASITAAAIKAALVFGALHVATGGGSTAVVTAIVTAIDATVLEDTVVLPSFTVGPAEIFSGRLLLFDPNIFNPKDVYVLYNVMDSETETVIETDKRASFEEWNETYKLDGENQATGFYYDPDGVIDNDTSDDIGTSINNAAYELREVISKWYYILRTISLIGSMLILLYIGIRIILSSIAEDKAKYKQMLGDWVVALCLIFLMHYIMVFAHNIVENITKIFNTSLESTGQIAVIVEPEENLEESVQKIEEKSGKQYIFDEDGVKSIKWPTNLMGRFRVEAQNKNGTLGYLGYTLAYVALVLFTLVFAFTYIKRLLYLLFLTVIAPLVALTYPIDKIHDGKAQAFNMWLKEYIFNLLIQPFHLLLYTVFVTMAFELAGTNVIYSLVVLGFMVPAEKFLRTMFGFNKASTPGVFGGAAGAALAMSAVTSLGKFAKGGGNHGGNGSKGKDSENEEKAKVRTADSAHSQQSLFANLAAENGDEDDSPANSGNSTGGSSSAGSGDSTSQDDDSDDNDDSDEIPLPDDYRNQGYGQNADGHYFNPWTDEYDEDYDPRTDKYFAKIPDEYTNQGYGQNADGHYFNPWTDEYDENYDPRTDKYFAKNNKKPLAAPRTTSTPAPTPAPTTAPTTATTTATTPAPTTPPTVATPAPDNNKKPGKFKRAVGATARSAGRAIKTTAISELKAAPGSLLRTAANIATATTLGAAGLATGIVSGDLNTAFRNTTAGAGVGYALSNGVANRISGTIKGGYDKGAKEKWQRDYYGDEYSKKMREKADEKFRKDKEIQRLYRDELGLKNKKEIEEAMRDAQKYRDYGINDNNIIIKAMKSDNGNALNRADNRRIAAAKLAENSPTAKELETNMKLFAKTPKMKQAQVDDMERLVRQINGI